MKLPVVIYRLRRFDNKMLRKIGMRWHGTGGDCIMRNLWFVLNQYYLMFFIVIPHWTMELCSWKLQHRWNNVEESTFSYSN
jgi:hypothetical protein